MSSVFIFFILLPLFQKGTFIDGMLYKTVAFNYAAGEASFWKMKFTGTSMPFFCEQPPFYFFSLGLFYQLFGTGFFADRLFTVLLFCALIVVFHAISQMLFTRHRFYFTSLVVFLFITIQVVCWSYVNQVIEPLVCLLSAIGIYLFLKFLKSGLFLYAILFSSVLLLLFLTKGFQSCFVIGLPIIYFFLDGFKKKIFYFSISTVLMFSLMMIGLWLYEPAAAWFNCYYNGRVLLTLNNTGSTTTYHTEIIIRYFTELLPPLLLTFLFFSYISVKFKYPFKFILRNFISNKLALSMLLVSLLGSFPFAISLVQRGFYLLPSFVFFIIALVYGFKRYWMLAGGMMIRTLNYFVVRLGLFLLAIVCVFYFILRVNDYKRDKELLNDVALILPYLEPKDTVLIEEDLWNYFSLHALLYMDKRVNLSTSVKSSKYVLKNKKDQNGEGRIPLPTKQLDLCLNR